MTCIKYLAYLLVLLLFTLLISIQNPMESKGGYGGSSGVPKEVTSKDIDVGVSYCS